MDKEIVIKQGQESIWKRIYIALLLTAIFYLLFEYFTNQSFVLKKFDRFGSLLHILEFSIYLLVPALSMIRSKNFHFNFEKKQYKIEILFGRFHYGKWKPLPQLEYISVFKKFDFYEVNLWYYKNNHFNIYTLSEYKNAIKVGVQIADKLEIDVLDASSKHDYQWLDKTAFSESGIIKYLK